MESCDRVLNRKSSLQNPRRIELKSPALLLSNFNTVYTIKHNSLRQEPIPMRSTVSITSTYMFPSLPFILLSNAGVIPPRSVPIHLLSPSSEIEA